MDALFLKPDAMQAISGMAIDPLVKMHCLEVIARGFTVIRGAVPADVCQRTIEDFRRFERANAAIFGKHRSPLGHYPRLINLHTVMPSLQALFTANQPALEVQDRLFGRPTALYTSLFYETGSQQPIHRDTPVFSTRPEYQYFGVTVYLEPSGEDNGCLEVVEYGHTLPELDRQAMAIAQYGALENWPKDGDLWLSYQEAVGRQCREAGLTVRKVPVGAGDTLIWHPQLPHGGSVIRDQTRTRFSLVMHCTPVGVPVYHQDAFFRPSVAYPDTAAWPFREVNGRMMADHGWGVSFGHEHSYPGEAFRQPQADGESADPVVAPIAERAGEPVTVDFRVGGNLTEFQPTGFSRPEDHGTWSLGKQSSIVLPSRQKGTPSYLTMTAFPYTIEGIIPKQTVKIQANGVDVFAGDLTGWKDISVLIPETAIGDRPEVMLTFRYPLAIAPRNAGQSSDDRQLALLFQRLSLQAAPG